jgi:drug/metabolite transporter superfamily protein YnfA
MTPETVVLAAQSLASGIMCGVIWFVQAVHYPLFAAVPGEQGAVYATLNRNRTAWVVLPPMILEAVAATWLVIWPPAGVGRLVAVFGLAIVAVLWLSTLVVQMPLHLRLGREGSTPEVVGRLVQSNWLRTVFWTARAIMAVYMLAVGRP